MVPTSTEGERKSLASKGECKAIKSYMSLIPVTVLQIVSGSVPTEKLSNALISVMELEPQPDSVSQETRELAFIDGDYYSQSSVSLTVCTGISTQISSTTIDR